jgi:hypothetical protein
VLSEDGCDDFCAQAALLELQEIWGHNRIAREPVFSPPQEIDPELRRRWEQVQTEVDGQIELELLDLLRSNPCGALKQMTHLPSITKATQQRLSGELKGKQECGES